MLIYECLSNIFDIHATYYLLCLLYIKQKKCTPLRKCEHVHLYIARRLGIPFRSTIHLLYNAADICICVNFFSRPHVFPGGIALVKVVSVFRKAIRQGHLFICQHWMLRWPGIPVGGISPYFSLITFHEMYKFV